AGVIGLSAGARAALALATLHPERCSAVIALVPATHVPGTPVPLPGAVGAAIMRYALHSDLLLWAGNKVARDRMVGTLLATDPALLDGADPAEQARADAILDQILPVSARSDGFLNDARLSLHPEDMPLATITAPTLAILLEDDRFGTFPAAQYIAQTVPGARLVSYPSGGHVFIGHAEDIYAEIDDFLRSNPPV
ncbi:MAG TPA: alpha/beta hydrolase, partial [Paracoccaceae bacterium]|nr:alpha/beta hydrolase [Paracoccaceae bacterium]